MFKPEACHSHFVYHAAQLPVLGESGQACLAGASVHISGLGRIGTGVALNLAAAGVGSISGNDPQMEEAENIGPFLFCRPKDLGRPKVFVLEEFLHGRPGLIFEPLAEMTESDLVDPYIAQSDLVISCANTLSARLSAESKAIRMGKPVVQVAVDDGSKFLGGMITLRLPQNEWSACLGCYLENMPQFPRGEGLLTTATSVLAAIAANMAVALLTGVRAEFLNSHNLFLVNLESYSIEALTVERRKECGVCGPVQRAVSANHNQGV